MDCAQTNSRVARVVFNDRISTQYRYRPCGALDCLFAALFLIGCFTQGARAETLDWATRPNVSILSPAAPDVATPNVVTVTSAGSGTGTVTAGTRVIDILPAGTLDTHTGIVQSEMDSTIDDLSTTNTTAFAFSNPVYNLCFTVVDIDGSATTSSGGSTFNDRVQFSPVPTSTPTIGTNVVYNAGTGLAQTNGAYITNTTGDIRVCYAGPVSNVSVQHIAGPVAGTNNPTQQFTAVDDLTYDPPPTVTVSKVSNGGTGTFAFTGNNGFTAHNVITATAGVAVAGPRRILSLPGVATIITEGVPPAGFALTGIACAGLGTGGTATPNLAARTVTFDAAATALGSNITCTFTNTRATVKVQKITLGGVGGPFTFADTNITGAVANITTVTAGTPTPAAPATSAITTMGTAVTLTEGLIAGYALTAASCTDANSAVTGNSGSIGSFAGNVLTIPAANVVAGADFTCVFTNTRATIKVQKITTGGVAGPFTFADTNIAGALPNITTAAVGTATPAAPAASNVTTVGNAVTITETVVAGYTLIAASCTDANSAVTGNIGARGTLAGNVLTLPAADVDPGTDYTCVFTNAKIPTVKVQKITLGGFGGPFTFAQSNLASAPAGITTLAAGTATPAAPAPINVTSIGTLVTVTETPIAGYALTAASCTDANSAVTGNTGVIGSFTGNVLTIPAAAVVAGADFTCVFTNTRATLKLQKITIGGFGGPFAFVQTNLASLPAAITTTAAGVAAPAAPTPINVLVVGAGVTLTETVAADYMITSASCTDANSAVTGNTGSIGTLAGNTLNLPAANVKAGSDFTCVFTNTKLVPAMTVTKSANTAGPVSAGQVIIYTFLVTNTGNTTISNISVGETFNGFGTAPAPGSEFLSINSAPLGDSTDAAANGTWDLLGPGDQVTFTAPYTVTLADVEQLQ